MGNRNFIIGVVLLLMVVGGVGCQSQARGTADDASLEASGMIEARQVSVASELGGQVVEVMIEEGQRVTADQPLIKLDDSSLVAQRDQAQATLRAARANLAALKAGPTADQIRAAEAQLAQAEANLHMVRANRDALTKSGRPETVAAVQAGLDYARDRYYNMRVTFTTEQLEKVMSAFRTAEGNLSTARVRHAELAEDSRHPAYIVAAAETAIEDAQALVDATERFRQAIEDTSRPYYAQIELARLCWEIAQVNLDQAQAWLSGLEADERASPDALAAAEAWVQDAQNAVGATKAAYEALISGPPAEQLNAAWARIEQLQTQLAGFMTASSTAYTLTVRMNANLRRGPGMGYPAVGALTPGDRFRILSANEAETWLQIETEEGETGWVAAYLVEGTTNIANTPAASAALTAATSSVSSAEALLAQIDAATAARDMAAAKLSELKSGARPEEIEAAEAKVAQAQAALEAIQVQLAKTTLHAPVNGVVINRAIQPGEMASPGATLLRLADLDQVNLTVFIAETQIGKVQLGQPARVSVDTFPERAFEGEVTFIAQEAEFTPENVQTEEQRAKLVFAVRISLDNPDHLLKPGMPADAVIEVDNAGG